MILDTNVLLYHTKDLLQVPLTKGLFSVSFITEIEILAFPSISPEEDAELRRMLTQDITVVGLTPAIKERAIQVRRAYRTKLPDAIIVATQSRWIQSCFQTIRALRVFRDFAVGRFY